MGTIHHRRAERNLLLILRDRLVRSEEKLVFRGISRHCLVDNGMDREGGEGLRRLFGIPEEIS